MAYYSKTDDLSFTPLTPEQELDLFTRYYKGDLAARDEILRHHLKLAAKLGLRFAKGYLPPDVAISAANYGLVVALNARRFRPGKVRFGSYLREYVRSEVLSEIRGERAIRRVQIVEMVVPAEVTVTGIKSRNGAMAAEHKAHYVLGNIFEQVVDPEGENNQLREVRRDFIQRALTRLSKVEAHCIRCVLLEEGTRASAARDLGLSKEALRKAYNRAVRKLRSFLAPVKSELL